MGNCFANYAIETVKLETIETEKFESVKLDELIQQAIALGLEEEVNAVTAVDASENQDS